MHANSNKKYALDLNPLTVSKTKKMSIIDLHCDLLAFLAEDENRTPFDKRARCSYPQLQQGGVSTQVLAIFSETKPSSLAFGLKQLHIFKHLPSPPKEISFIPAIENASCFALEDEPLDQVLERFEKIFTTTPFLYMSLTWNGENRFGGGCGSSCGLKEEGKILLEFLSGKEVSIDLSHASDALSEDILNRIDQKGLDLSVLASHANFRKVHPHLRNLPDPIGVEISKRNGLIGFVLYSEFLKTPEQLIKHIEHGVELGGEEALCFGADFFSLEDLKPQGTFFEEMSDASKYGSIVKSLSHAGVSKQLIEALCYKNAARHVQGKKRLSSFVSKESTSLPK